MITFNGATEYFILFIDLATSQRIHQMVPISPMTILKRVQTPLLTGTFGKWRDSEKGARIGSSLISARRTNAKRTVNSNNYLSKRSWNLRLQSTWPPQPQIYILSMRSVFRLQLNLCTKLPIHCQLSISKSGFKCVSEPRSNLRKLQRSQSYNSTGTRTG